MAVSGLLNFSFECMRTSDEDHLRQMFAAASGVLVFFFGDDTGVILQDLPCAPYLIYIRFELHHYSTLSHRILHMTCTGPGVTGLDSARDYADGGYRRHRLTCASNVFRHVIEFSFLAPSPSSDSHNREHTSGTRQIIFFLN